MNEEVNTVLQVYQSRLNALTAQNIAFEAKILTLQKQIQELQTPPPTVDGGELEETKSE
jgi:prefoldin subunit 5